MSTTCPLPTTSLSSSISPKLHYLLSGTFNTIFLYLLSFNPQTSTLSIHAKIRAEGPHQFLALNRERSRAYATTWAKEATLSAWEVVEGGRGGLKHINTVPITATGSYIQVSESDPPYIYSAGGPTGEVHEVDPATGGFGKKVQELLYVEEGDLEKADKTRVALRYGSHGIDINPSKNQVFVPHLGHNSIFMYSLSPYTGLLTLLSNCPSFGTHDGPRHVIPSADGEVLYAVTEHTSYVDVYKIEEKALRHLQRLDILPPEKQSSRPSYRGDTLRLSPSGKYLFATTRGMTSSTQGYLTVFPVSSSSSLLSPSTYYQTPTSGGKANAVELFPFKKSIEMGEKDWVVLTDDEKGWVWVLEWDEKEGTVKEVAGVQLGADEEAEEEEKGTGASHAVWLS